MQKDPLEILLLRHYGDTAQAPPGLEERLLASVRQEVVEPREEQCTAARFYQKRVSRRQAFKLFASGTGRVGFDALNAGLDGLQMLESALTGQDVTQKAFP
jgi:hypothetical protein